MGKKLRQYGYEFEINWSKVTRGHGSITVTKRTPRSDKTTGTYVNAGFFWGLWTAEPFVRLANASLQDLKATLEELDRIRKDGE